MTKTLCLAFLMLRSACQSHPTMRKSIAGASIDAGVIEQARRGYVRFAVPYMADYLRSQL